VLQRTDSKLEQERDYFIHQQELTRQAKARWGYRLAVPLLAVIAISAFPGAAQRLAAGVVAVYYQILDPVPSSASAPTGPLAGNRKKLSPDGLLSALSSSFPNSQIRVENSPPMVPDSPLLFAHQPTSSLFQDAWQGSRPVGTHEEPWRWSEAIGGLAPKETINGPINHHPIVALKEAQRGRPLHQRERAQLFVAACLAEGHSARLIELSGDGQVWTRVASEVFDPSAGRWFLVDPELNGFFEQRGERLSASDLQAAWNAWKREVGLAGAVPREKLSLLQQGQAFARTGIRFVPIGPARQVERDRLLSASPTGLLLEHFEYVAIPARNNFATQDYPPGHPVDTARFGIVQDPDTPRRPTVCPYLDVHSVRALYPTIGGSRIDVLDAEVDVRQPRLRLSFATYTPNFDHFQVRVGAAPWQDIQGDLFTWTLNEPALSRSNRREFSIQVRSVNRSGIIGPLSQMRLSVEPLRFRSSQL
jgi:hypothetical protein